MKKVHLICNSHIDPIWLWEWEEGASAAVSTFRSAADLSEKYNFVFNHNEVTLYKWIEEYAPDVFEKIKSLIKRGKWHVTGGWYLQPDCNIPSGESLVRQIMEGRKYFTEKFGEKPTTAMNVDPFGHSVGLVQIMKKCGYDSYLFCRPYPDGLELKDDRFIWVGLDGSEIKCFRSSSGYLTLFGEAAEKIRQYTEKYAAYDVGMFLWGVGNHGGGPSAKDLEDIELLMKESNVEIVHSTPENFFADTDGFSERFTGSLYPSMVGCFSSMSRVKRLHRSLENTLYFTEKICTVAANNGLIEYPAEDLSAAEENLLNAEFHDVLPGSSIKTGGEEGGIRKMYHGLEILSRLRARAFFAISDGFDRITEEAYPIFVFNPHPYEINYTVDCEFMLANQNWNDDFTFFNVYDGDTQLPSQIIQESSNLNLDWRKRVVFDCKLKPMSMNRFECKPYKVPGKPSFPAVTEDFVFENKFYKLTLDASTGFVKSLIKNGEEYLNGQAFVPLLINDTDDPWGMSKAQTVKLGEKADVFTMMTDKDCSVFAGLKNKIVNPVRIIEDGEVETVAETSFRCRNSAILTRYVLYKNRPDFEVKFKVFWNEKSMALKVSVPTSIAGGYYGETPFGYEKLPDDGREVVSQKWLAKRADDRIFSIINDGVYSSSCEGGNILITLLRSPAYSGHPISDRDILRQDRFTDRMDQGEHDYSFLIKFGKTDKIAPCLSADALIYNEKPFAQNVYPSGDKKRIGEFLTLNDKKITLSAMKETDDGHTLIRLFNENGFAVKSTVKIHGYEKEVTFGKFEVKTFIIDGGGLTETETMEI